MIKKLIIVLIIAVIAVVVAKDKIIELSIERICTDITGARFDIKKMNVDILRPVIDIDELVIYNPKGFPDEIMAEVPEIYISVDVKRSLAGVIHIKELRFNLQELNVVRNAEGVINLDALNPVKNRKKGKEAEDSGGIPAMDIEVLKLRGGQVHFKDYSKGPVPSVHTFNVGVNETYHDIDDLYTLVRLIISRVIRGTMVSNIVNLPMEEVNKVLKGTYGVIGKATNTTTGVLVGAEHEVESIAGKVGGMFKGLFSGGSSREKE